MVGGLSGICSAATVCVHGYTLIHRNSDDSRVPFSLCRLKTFYSDTVELANFAVQKNVLYMGWIAKIKHC